MSFLVDAKNWGCQISHLITKKSTSIDHMRQKDRITILKFWLTFDTYAYL